MNQDLDILQLVMNASFVVQFVMLSLMLVSIASWSAIFRKIYAIKETANATGQSRPKRSIIGTTPEVETVTRRRDRP